MQISKLNGLNIFYTFIWGGNLIYLIYFIFNRIYYYNNSNGLLFFTLPVDTFLYYTFLFIILGISSLFIPKNPSTEINIGGKINPLTRLLLLCSFFIYFYSMLKVFIFS